MCTWVIDVSLSDSFTRSACFLLFQFTTGFVGGGAAASTYFETPFVVFAVAAVAGALFAYGQYDLIRALD